MGVGDGRESKSNSMSNVGRIDEGGREDNVGVREFSSTIGAKRTRFLGFEISVLVNSSSTNNCS